MRAQNSKICNTIRPWANPLDVDGHTALRGARPMLIRCRGQAGSRDRVPLKQPAHQSIRSHVRTRTHVRGRDISACSFLAEASFLRCPAYLGLPSGQVGLALCHPRSSGALHHRVVRCLHDLAPNLASIIALLRSTSPPLELDGARTPFLTSLRPSPSSPCRHNVPRTIAPAGDRGREHNGRTLPQFGGALHPTKRSGCHRLLNFRRRLAQRADRAFW
jgi:hypothetical protein